MKFLRRKPLPEEIRRQMMSLVLKFGLVEALLIAVGVTALETAHGHSWGLYVYLPLAIIGEIYMWIFVVRFARLVWRARRTPAT